MIVLLGPTASGKTQLATQLAHRIGGEIISADSRQVYRHMTIGTGKDLSEYVVKGKSIPYHLIDILDPGEKYHVFQFQQDVAGLLPQIYQRKQVPILCGGTGLYIHSVLQNYGYTGIPVNEPLRQELETQEDDDLLKRFRSIPSSYSQLADVSTRKRLIRAIEIATWLLENSLEDYPGTTLPEYTVFGLNPPVEVRRARISKRLHERLELGLIEEVDGLLKSGLTAAQLIYYGLEYKYVTEYLTGIMSLTEMTKKLETEIHRYAKRQMTYFRKMERDGIRIQWLSPHQKTEEWIEFICSQLPLPPNLR
ncbi:tRNA (adenosine(37)-N6)-dimethylallyltransferase MiaA [Arundinibacter roseus]|uniref:tRNA dimethylallyltransferase n=1 Tax=Arundinibacter roseus TaxID=2070510 RepID=A0A4R4KJX3_9BACT|nr:tRNA (adenosine(37)-N6)-dimethylallyltransferase MiaA [Arundinibacter roseus]TDB66929.1 tRNA (adenosine(37)-N6)-dimethylallyltransferase MiaA [Arundinibacter roseus]